tara:strand:+ start:171 stop:587 length:417 start_codon:yes stop_codon:yes gene_type:complete
MVEEKDIELSLTEPTIIPKIKSDVKEKLKDIGLKPATLSKLVQFTMEAIEETPIKGSEQKDFAIRIMKSLVIDLPENNPEKKFLLDSLDSGSVDGTIELVVAASKNELTINHVVEVSKACLPRLLDYVVTRCGSRQKK